MPVERLEITARSFVYFNLLAIFTGIACGIIAIGFRYLIFGFNDIFFNKSSLLLGAFSPYYIFVIPAVGGLFVGLLTYYLASEAKGHGVPEVMASMALYGGKIRPRVVGVKALASSICIGSGGSAGREGPIVQMGAATGSTIAQKLGFNPYYTKVLVACGAAGAIAGTFNTPIAGALFALELIIRELKVRSITPIVISAVFATIVSRVLLSFLGAETAFIFAVPSYSLETPWEILFYSVLGILAALTAIGFIKSLYGIEDIFEKIKVPEYLKPVIGGLCLGAIGLIILLTTGEPLVFGVGYEAISKVLHNELFFTLVFALIFLKIIATSITLGSGGSGGIFAPSLFIGAMLGGAFGMLVHQGFPTITASHEAYAIVGMSAVFAGGSGAILTSIIMVFEMTGDYAIILPVMFASVISTSVAKFLMNETIYTLKLSRRGIAIEQEMSITLMKTITVREIMKTEVDTVNEDLPIDDLVKKIVQSGHMGYPVLDNEGKLRGIVTRSDVEKAMKTAKPNLLVKDIMRRDTMVAYPGDTLEDVLMRVGFKDVSHFPVVDPEDRTKLLGFYTKGDMFRVYKHKRVKDWYTET